jgi:hypothetical protein
MYMMAAPAMRAMMAITPMASPAFPPPERPPEAPSAGEDENDDPIVVDAGRLSRLVG